MENKASFGNFCGVNYPENDALRSTASVALCSVANRRLAKLR